MREAAQMALELAGGQSQEGSKLLATEPRRGPACPPTSPRPDPDLYPWRPGLRSLSPAKAPCPGRYGEQWQKAHAATLDCLERFGERAVELGWTDLELFGIHPQSGTGRADRGRALFLIGRQVEAIDAKR